MSFFEPTQHEIDKFLNDRSRGPLPTDRFQADLPNNDFSNDKSSNDKSSDYNHPYDLYDIYDLHKCTSNCNWRPPVTDDARAQVSNNIHVSTPIEKDARMYQSREYKWSSTGNDQINTGKIYKSAPRSPPRNQNYEPNWGGQTAQNPALTADLLSQYSRRVRYLKMKEDAMLYQPTSDTFRPTESQELQYELIDNWRSEKFRGQTAYFEQKSQVNACAKKCSGDRSIWDARHATARSRMALERFAAFGQQPSKTLSERLKFSTKNKDSKGHHSYSYIFPTVRLQLSGTNCTPYRIVKEAARREEGILRPVMRQHFTDLYTAASGNLSLQDRFVHDRWTDVTQFRKVFRNVQTLRQQLQVECDCVNNGAFSTKFGETSEIMSMKSSTKTVYKVFSLTLDRMIHAMDKEYVRKVFKPDLVELEIIMNFRKEVDRLIDPHDPVALHEVENRYYELHEEKWRDIMQLKEESDTLSPLQPTSFFQRCSQLRHQPQNAGVTKSILVSFKRIKSQHLNFRRPLGKNNRLRPPSNWAG